jgi:hypothetical protein
MKTSFNKKNQKMEGWNWKKKYGLMWYKNQVSRDEIEKTN